MLVLTGSEKLSKQVFMQMAANFRETAPVLPGEFWDRANIKFDARYKMLQGKIIAIYDKYYTQEDMEGLVAFYKSSLGQKVIAKTPGISKEILDLGNEVGKELAKEIVAEMEAEAAKSKPVSSGFDKRPFKGNGKPVVTGSGLKYEDMTVGTGATAIKGNICVMHYTGTLTSGERFDSSRDRNQPFEFSLGAGEVIQGWDEGVAGMRVGGRRRLVIPASLGYGSSGAGPIPPNATLIFDVELIGIK